MSHELRTPLNAIIGYSEMLQEEAEDLDADAFLPDLQRINAAGKHLLGLINDILDLSKIEAGRMDLHLEQFDVGELVRDVASIVKPLIDKNGNTLIVTCPDDIGEMQADLTKVRQTLFNLLSNAAKFTDHGTISLSAARESGADGEWIAFGVADTGIGMTEEQLGRLFAAFSQAEASSSRRVLRGQDLEGREAGRSARRAAEQVRVHHQLADRAGFGAHHPSVRTAAGDRADPVGDRAVTSGWPGEGDMREAGVGVAP
jgi:signal transduction histidine kinase